ncbi:aminotransferase class IV family protein [Nocardia sp. KC 131]|uniref:aminotransferase class IV family protein n=1 Tax=Nocardia arseniciresistens TaxID=3392119 RepID=UPI00398E78CA
MGSFVAQRNGLPATVDDLTPRAFSGFAHFTAMQIRGGGVRGLDLHLARLRTASQQLYGSALPDDAIIDYLAAAVVAGTEDLSLMATVYSEEGEFVSAPDAAQLGVLVRTGEPFDGPAGPLALESFEYERVLPEIKHVGEIAKTYFFRKAKENGFDDAAFVDRHGKFSEASIWNLAFWDGTSVVWPEAERLLGTTMSIVGRQLENLGVPQREQSITHADLAALTGAVVMNSWTPAVAVSRIDSVELADSGALTDIMHRAWLNEPIIAL